MKEFIDSESQITLGMAYATETYILASAGLHMYTSI